MRVTSIWRHEALHQHAWVGLNLSPSSRPIWASPRHRTQFITLILVLLAFNLILFSQHGSSHVLHHEEVIPRHPLHIRRQQWNRIHRRRPRRSGLLFPRSTAILPPRQLILIILLIFFPLGSWSSSYTVRFTPIPRKSLSTAWHMQQEPRLKITTAFSDASFATRSSGSTMTLVAAAAV